MTDHRDLVRLMILMVLCSTPAAADICSSLSVTNFTWAVDDRPCDNTSTLPAKKDLTDRYDYAWQCQTQG